MADSLISADVLSIARERYKNTFSKVIFHICCNKNRLEAENIFLARRINCKKPKTTIKISRSVTGNTHIFLFGLRTFFYKHSLKNAQNLGTY